MKKLSTFILHNSKLRRREDISFPINHRIVRFADGFFETMRAFAINIPLFNLHYQRILKAFDLLLLNKVNFPDENNLLLDIQRLIKSNKAFGSSRIRLTVYRSGEGNYFTDNDDIEWYVDIITLEENRFKLNQKGLFIDVFEHITKPINPIYSVKINHATYNILAAQWAKRRKLDDVLLINASNHIVEATSSNIFLLKNNILYTPPLSDGPVEGVMRKYLIEKLSALLNINIIEQSFTKDLLKEADEIFLTNAVDGCKSVLGYSNRRYYRNFSNQLINILNRELNHE